MVGAATLGLLGLGSLGCAPGAASPAQFPERVAEQRQPLVRIVAVAEPAPKAKVSLLPSKEPEPIQTALEPGPLSGDALILATTSRCPAEMALVEGRV
ncbi:MAG TPA: hypothetical protein VLS89_15895, partial [Candidatus Nanopelagicales bacterium]|nr:hypothetical protein [Candidatus Nanopelagicales bacterium]